PGIGLVDGAHLVLVGPETAVELGGSEWAFTVHGLDGGLPPAADLAAARALHDLVIGLVTDRMVAGVHDCADGGVAVALAEMAFAGGVGFAVAPETGVPTAAWCFAESASRILLAVTPDRLPEVLARAGDAGVR